MHLCFPAGHVCEPYAGGRPAVPGAAGRFVSQTGGTGGPECRTERPGDPHQPGNTHTPAESMHFLLSAVETLHSGTCPLSCHPMTSLPQSSCFF